MCDYEYDGKDFASYPEQRDLDKVKSIKAILAMRNKQVPYIPPGMAIFRTAH
jgi:hypothetical protein